MKTTPDRRSVGGEKACGPTSPARPAETLPRRGLQALVAPRADEGVRHKHREE